MADPALPTFLAMVQRELGADDAYLQLGGKGSDGQGRYLHTLAESTHVVVAFVNPPADSAALHARLAALSSTFRATLESAAASAARPRHVTDHAGQRLDEELKALGDRAGAQRAFVFDLDSPVIWGASPLEDPEADAIKRIERAAQQLREHRAELRQAQGHTLRVPLEGDVEALARPFAGLYVLALLFEGPLSEPIALGAVLHAIGLIERLVLAMPPIEPEPGAKILRLHGPGAPRKE